MALAATLALLPYAMAGADAPAQDSGACAVGPAPAQFGANTNRVGVIDLHVPSAPVGSTITYYECVGESAHRLGSRAAAQDAPFTSLLAATVWRCGRLQRHFAAVLTAPDGSSVRGMSSARTSSCARRFTLAVPPGLARGRLARVRVVDRWGIGGIRTTLCVTSPDGGRKTCRNVPFAAAAGVAARRFRLTSRGRWQVELRVRNHRVRDSIAVGVRTIRSRPLPTVLATGDSTMQGIDSYLSDALAGEATVVSDVRPGVGMSKGNGWEAIATSQATQLRPRTTVVSVGAAEGFPIAGAGGVAIECCGEPWIAAYARRTARTMRAYRRQGRGRVLWLTMPAPREAAAVTIFDAVNRAILRAAKGSPGVRVLRMDLLFTPAGYRDVMRYRGRDVRVREQDGIHLNISGAAIAARVVAQAVRTSSR